MYISSPNINIFARCYPIELIERKVRDNEASRDYNVRRTLVASVDTGCLNMRSGNFGNPLK